MIGITNANNDFIITNSVVNPNLLDNWLFTTDINTSGVGGPYTLPVNQRSQSEYSSHLSETIYCIDRWYIEDGLTASNIYDSSGIKLIIGETGGNPCFSQKVRTDTIYYPQMLSEPMTISVIIGAVSSDFKGARLKLYTNNYGDPQVIAMTDVITSPGIYSAVVMPNYYNYGSGLIISLCMETNNMSVGDYCFVLAIKLEKGDIQTLGYEKDGSLFVNESTNYQQELFKCQTSIMEITDLYANNQNLVGFQSRPNLLDNWYFVGGGSQQGGESFPINMSGQTLYSGSGYCINRWRINQTGAALSINNGYIRFQSETSSAGLLFYQVVPNANLLVGSEVTFSVVTKALNANAMRLFIAIRDSNNNDISFEYLSRTRGNELTDGSMYQKTITVPQNAFYIVVGIYGESNISNVEYIHLVAAKLEVGNSQTLAHLKWDSVHGYYVWDINELPDFQEELYKCKTSTDFNDPHANCKNAVFTTTPTSGRFVVTDGNNGDLSTSSYTVNSSGGIPSYQYSTTDLTPGTSSLTTGRLYFVYE